MMSLPPGLFVWTPPARGRQVMHVGMVGQLAGPGMQDAHQPDLATHKARIASELLGSLCGSPEQQVVNAFLVLAGKLAELCGEGEGQQEVGHGQQQFPLQLEPFFGLFVLALGTMAIACPGRTVQGGRNGSCTGFRHRRRSDRPGLPELLCGSVQWRAWLGGDWITTCWRTSGDKRDHSGERSLPVLGPQAGHQLIERVTGLRFGEGSQVRVNGGGGGGRVSQVTLDDA